VQVRTDRGIVEGVVSPDGLVRTFKGIPYAAPPVGPLRWQPPQSVRSWEGVRPTVDYPPRAMQGRIFTDMVFHDAGPSEDCLYLNLWMPAAAPPPRLPVMVWIHGGGFAAGATSEPRQDAGNLSKMGVLVVSMNYRLGVFGFLALPGLAQESPHHAAGNYGLLDQIAALQWVRRNIAAFGGDPANVTIFGQSAGSSAVSELMASPLARGLFRRAIGESGAFIDETWPMRSPAQAERAGRAFAESAFGTASVAALRAKPAAELLAAAIKLPYDYFAPVVDGYCLPTDCASIYAAGRQAHVALLAGWTRDEDGFAGFFGGDEPTVARYRARAATRFGARARAFLELYPAATTAEVRRAAADFEGDWDTGYSAWKWLELHRASSGAPLYRYEYDQTLPLPGDAGPNVQPVASHAAEIEYVFRVLSSRALPWRPEDHRVSELLAAYWTNFAKTGDPNGPGLPPWPKYERAAGDPVMHIAATSWAEPDRHRGRYEFIDRLVSTP
jgi:para-nitrobenzyl esterase